VKAPGDLVGVRLGALGMPQFVIDALEDEVRPQEG
tara:strand:- start:194 stop:298 length:105 start_codon:yes stop_codon:yes gene_type:complete